ncbi:Tfp pilus assembly protein PilN [Chitinivorax tropicus]|uniref:Tfp pilus assembly protein PilN n=1 Tax=Chitinivorax tropicus TaxID=714531 RepID=A0A840MNW8_9PROT|nr:PilN domain-containing protein [Chitinivorax tropicus]MBB5020338.1 Tfp pilus assembly protein PilN [Chitinivorax tropicus]
MLGVPLCVVGVALLTLFSMQVSSVEQKIEADRGALWRLRAPDSTQPQPDQQERDKAKDLSSQFARPWDILFSQLEKIEASDVRLTQILPDSGQRTVRLAGEAKTAQAMYDYMRRLGSEAGLRQIHLIQQKLDPEADVERFQLQAQWGPK